MSAGIRRYAEVAGKDVIDHLYQLAKPLSGSRVVHINSTRVGGGVAEILTKLVPLMGELGIDARWEVISGPDVFYQCTKAFHNGLQGGPVTMTNEMLQAYEDANSAFAEEHRALLEDAEIVIVHDPQPAPLINRIGRRKGKWVWRCHIDVSRPHRPVWKYLRKAVSRYDASIFSLANFAQLLPHPQYLITPSIDPLSEKNIPLSPAEVQAVFSRFNLDPQKPMILQVSRFDRFKDPLGVIRAYRLATRFIPSLQLVLAGGEASDDPEGQAVLDEVRAAAGDDPDIHVLLLPSDAHRIVNGLQRASDLVLQKSIREGFGLTVAEAMWKGKPVIGGNTGGIILQVINHHTGFLVDTPEGAALRIRYLLHNRSRLDEMGLKAKRFVRENFLLTRHLREYLTLMLALTHGDGGRITLT
ncbi:MAG: glycosyltransferase [Candidatus Eisenbacteria sp.]|nr:glycosyltransferase [Candidatus Eisenbacteria bacterium]